MTHRVSRNVSCTERKVNMNVTEHRLPSTTRLDLKLGHQSSRLWCAAFPFMTQKHLQWNSRPTSAFVVSFSVDNNEFMWALSFIEAGVLSHIGPQLHQHSQACFMWTLQIVDMQASREGERINVTKSDTTPVPPSKHTCTPTISSSMFVMTTCSLFCPTNMFAVSWSRARVRVGTQVVTTSPLPSFWVAACSCWVLSAWSLEGLRGGLRVFDKRVCSTCCCGSCGDCSRGCQKCHVNNAVSKK